MQPAIEAYLEYLQFEQRCSENTISAYRSDLTQFDSQLRKELGEGLDPSMISQSSCLQFIDWLKEREYRPSTIYRKVAAVRSFLEFLGERGMLPATSIREAMVYSPAERDVPEVLSKEEVEQLIDAPTVLNTPLAMRDHAILSLMYATGLRASDIVELAMNEVDLSAGVLQLPSTTLGLGNAQEPLKHYLEQGRPHLARVPEEMSVFLNQRGKGLTRQGLWLIVKKWARKAKIRTEISPHTLRHSLMQHLLDRGMSVKRVQRKLGMKSPNSIRIFNSPKREERNP